MKSPWHTYITCETYANNPITTRKESTNPLLFRDRCALPCASCVMLLLAGALELFPDVRLTKVLLIPPVPESVLCFFAGGPLCVLRTRDVPLINF